MNHLPSIFILCAALIPVGTGANAATKVSAMKLPGFVYRPMITVDERGTLHLVCAHKEKRGDLFYLKKSVGQKEFSKPIQVNSTPGCAAAFNMAIGKGGRVHVLIRPNAIYSRDKLQRRPKFIDLKYMLYHRLNDEGTAFEKERDLSGETFGFEGVGAILASADGEVDIFWHGWSKPGKEPTREIFHVKSTDEGKTFSAIKPIAKDVKGACACCSMQGTMDEAGNFYLLYRNSEADGGKHSYLLTSKDKGKTFQSKLLGKWPQAGCPGSVYSMINGRGGVLLGWDTKGHVYFTKAAAKMKHIVAPSHGISRSPVLATNSRGEILFAWAEAGSPKEFREGGNLAWQIFDKDGKPISKKQVLPGTVAKWSFPAAYATQEGDFVILYDGEKARE